MKRINELKLAHSTLPLGKSLTLSYQQAQGLVQEIEALRGNMMFLQHKVTQYEQFGKVGK